MFFTPQNKLVKPDRSAFHSTGFLSKKNRPRQPQHQTMPETPLKKGATPAFSFSFPGLASHSTPSAALPPSSSSSSYTEPPSPSHSNHLGIFTPTKAPASSVRSKKHRSPLSESPVKSNKKIFLASSSPTSARFNPTSVNAFPSPFPSLVVTDETSPVADRSWQAGLGPRFEKAGVARHRRRSHTSPSMESKLFRLNLSTPQDSNRSTSAPSENSTPSTDSSTRTVSNPFAVEGKGPGLLDFSAVMDGDDTDMMDCDEETPKLLNESPNGFSSILKRRQPVLAAYSHLVTPYPRFLMMDYFTRLRERNGRPPSPDETPLSEEYPDYFETQFRVLGPVGRGSFADVFRAQSKTDGMVYAVKKTRAPFSGYKDGLHKLEEVEMLWKVGSCPHVISLISAWVQFGYLYLQMELCPNGSLHSYLEEQARTSRVEEYRIWRILAEITSGLKHIHNLDIAHLDLKPENILITADGSLKIGDFGLASKTPVSRGEDREGDRTYIAPELFRDATYGKPADIYSLGLIILETAANVVLPENGPYWQKLREGDISDIDASLKDISPPLIDLIRSMLAPLPAARPTAEDIWAHPILQSIVGQGGAVSGALSG
ncbi:hypothetical protein HDV00_011943 [Rhizophlyctis rosea]|nr:hypothetical protein HDV00_011943 [Rhizophlyctis rosea]